MGLIDNATKPLRQAGRIGGWAAERGLDAVNTVRGRIRPGSPPKDLDDVTIARKVESEIFRSPTVAKGKIDVNVVDGVVYLRGVAKTPAQVRSIEAKARTVPEVREVQNLLHLPNTPAPTRASTPRSQQRTRRKPGKPAAPRTEEREMNADKTSPRTGDSPVELAAARKGRPPAKLQG